MCYLWLDYRWGSGRWAETRVCHGSSQPSHAFLWQQLMGMAGNLCEVSLAWFSLQLHLSSRRPFSWIVASSSSAFFFSFAGGNSWSAALGGRGGGGGGGSKIWGLLQNIHRLVQLIWGMWGWRLPNLPPHPTATGGSCSPGGSAVFGLFCFFTGVPGGWRKAESFTHALVRLAMSGSQDS